MTRPLGKNQRWCLYAMTSYGRGPERGYPGGGWVWGNHSTTIRLLESLVKRGLVERYEYLPHDPALRQTLGLRTAYRLTDAGRQAAKEKP